jgi:hypothetical protein
MNLEHLWVVKVEIATLVLFLSNFFLIFVNCCIIVVRTMCMFISFPNSKRWVNRGS